ncbi:hypothetical protein Kuja_0900 [Vibrio phage vB_VchM_Kuja]|uniref:Uncharacterized protein n=1 Tax=Vibrio phage vB_VchM_Kuja TaxID=2686437 RepID=A0A6B9J5D7_9CAUD|nr:hypothetical protein HWC83_gp146 [Vibrio phage vB_VchM_Kuja]QGZ16081.1 hypothetical protein Kuja_0900 [Vibrio phage vB_VchM_Kuja]
MEKVCVAVDHKHDDSNGAYSIFYMWDGKEVSTEGGMYSGLAYNHYSVDASEEQIKAASDYMRETAEEGYAYNRNANCFRGDYTYIGCVVKLARSRKAPNNTELEVIDYIDRFYNKKFHSWVEAKIVVQNSDGNTYYVSVGCIKEVVKGVKELPYWVK